ncbi:MAG: hypothetical protein WBM69_18530 [Desulfobacterales bacterium]
MEFSNDTEKFLLGSKEAYNKFRSHQTPFAAVKIYVSGLRSEGAKIDGIVANNFRSDRDAILKSENNYAILMHNTYFKGAEAVLDRISLKLSRLKYGVKNTTKKPQLNAYACIYGAGEESAKLQFRHLELINPLRKKNEYEKLQPKIGEYLRWIRPLKSNDHQAFSIKV